MSLKLLPAALLALMAVQACDGTPFGQQLSDSFDGSSSESSSGNPPPSVQSKVESVKEEPIERVAVNEASGKEASGKEASGKEVSGKEATVKAEAAESETLKTEATPQPSTSARRLPYRASPSGCFRQTRRHPRRGSPPCARPELALRWTPSKKALRRSRLR